MKTRPGLSEYQLHDLRHTFITDLVAKGVDIITIMEKTGHKDIRMIKRYSHPTDNHKKQAVQKLVMKYEKYESGLHNGVQGERLAELSWIKGTKVN